MTKLIAWLFKIAFRISLLFVVAYFLLKTGGSNEQEVNKILTKQQLGGEMASGPSMLKYIKGSWAKFWKEGPTPYEKLGVLNEEIKNKHIKRFQRVAVVEQKKFGIPTSVILANSLLISNSGESELAKRGNNFFALPYTEDWVGDTISINQVVYRKYKNAWSSFRDHSYFLTTGKNAVFKKIPADNYQSWTEIVGNQVYSQFPNFAGELQKVIHEYGLEKLDRIKD